MMKRLVSRKQRDLRFGIAVSLTLRCFGSRESPNASAIDWHPVLKKAAMVPTQTVALRIIGRHAGLPNLPDLHFYVAHPTASTVAAGHSIGVSGEYFATGAPQELAVGWNQTVVGSPVSRLVWGGTNAKPAQLNVVTTTQLNYDAVDLSPSSRYQFTGE
jgi:hypothetical protein